MIILPLPVHIYYLKHGCDLDYISLYWIPFVLFTSYNYIKEMSVTFSCCRQDYLWDFQQGLNFSWSQFLHL